MDTEKSETKDFGENEDSIFKRAYRRNFGLGTLQWHFLSSQPHWVAQTDECYPKRGL